MCVCVCFVIYLSKSHVGTQVPHVLFLDGLLSNIDGLVDRQTWLLTPAGKEMAAAAQEAKKSCPQMTVVQQAADCAKTHCLEKHPFQDDDFATMNVEAKMNSAFTPQQVKNAVTAVRKLGLPPASLDVIERAMFAAFERLPACLTKEIVQAGFKKANYPDVNVPKILLPCASFAALAQVDQARIVELCETELTTEYLKHDWLSDGMIVATLKREKIEIAQSGFFPSVDEASKTVNERRTLGFMSQIFRDDRMLEMQVKRDTAQALANEKSEKKRKQDEKRQQEAEQAKKKMKMTSCSFCAKKEVKNDEWTMCTAKKCTWSVCGKTECQGIMATHLAVGH